jgi:hypothetical protein
MVVMGLGSFPSRLGVPGGTSLLSENYSREEDAGASPIWMIFETSLANFGEFPF